MRDGEIHLFSESLAHRVELGRCKEEGFIPHSWGEWSEVETEELRQALIGIFFEEEMSHDPLSQREWPDAVLNFLDLDDISDQQEIEALETLNEKDLGVRRRFLNKEGFPCQGLYQEKGSDDGLLIRQGHLIERRRLLRVKSDNLWIGCLVSESMGPWLDEKGEVLDLEEKQWDRMKSGQAKVGVFHFGLLKDLQEKGQEIESLGWCCSVYPHLDKEGHYRMVCWTNEKLNDLLSDEQKKLWMKKYPAEELDWSLGFGELLGQENSEPKPIDDLKALLEGVPSAWVFAEIVN